MVLDITRDMLCCLIFLEIGVQSLGSHVFFVSHILTCLDCDLWLVLGGISLE